MATQGTHTSSAGPTQGASDAAAASGTSSRQQQANAIVKRSVFWVLGIGLVPLPLVDLLARTGVQVKMLKEISGLYGVNFFEDKAKALVASLASGLGAWITTGVVASSLFKIVPGIGQAVGMVGGSVIGGALTVAVGNVFIRHYEAGGTLLDFDADKTREYFKQEFERAKTLVRQMQQEGKQQEGKQQEGAGASS